MKYLRSRGQSFTEIVPTNDAPNSVKRKSLRNLKLVKKSEISRSELLNSDIIKHDQLEKFFLEDYLILLRQYIAIVDKICRKPRPCRLGSYHPKAYIERVGLTSAVWELYQEKYIQGNNDIDEEASEKLKTTWYAKSHPYAEFEVDEKLPAQDDNYVRINKIYKKNLKDAPYKAASIGVFTGPWASLWVKDNNKPNYKETALAIHRHLVEEERKICGKPREENGQPSGLIAKKAKAIINSVSTPNFNLDKNKYGWEDSDEEIYFYHDIAEKIFDALVELRDLPRKDRFPKKVVGKLLHEHFRPILLEQYGKLQQDRLWKLHNAVRTFYRKKCMSARFLRELNEEACRLNRVCPETTDELKRNLRGKIKSSKVSELIRQGRVLYHALDLSEEPNDLHQTIRERLDFFWSSEGQSYIKRAETFGRLWKNSVSLALRTNKAWADPEGDVFHKRKKGGVENYDLTDHGVRKEALKQLDLDAFNEKVPLIFGEKEFIFKSQERFSKASIFKTNSHEIARETMGAALKIVSVYRNKTNHFTSRKRFVNTIKVGDPNYRFSENFQNKIDKLLQFDLDLRGQLLADTLIAIKANLFLNQEMFSQLSKIFSTYKVSVFAVPKFQKVMERLNNLQEREFFFKATKDIAILKVKGLSTSKNHLLKCQIGLLRLIYERQFPAWLENFNDTEKLKDLIREIYKDKEKRIPDEDKTYYNLTESKALDLLNSEQLTITNFFDHLNAELAADKKSPDPYNPDKDDISKKSHWANTLKQDIIGQLFAHFISENNLEWINDLSEQESKLNISANDFTFQTFDKDPWHSQFYFFLHLIPVDDVSLLRQQFIKTSLLDGKTIVDGINDSNDHQDLKDLTTLLELYCNTGDMCFEGKEHVSLLKGKAELYSTKDFFHYEDTTQENSEKNVFPGTQRGLRQICRFGHLKNLKKIFEKHTVSEVEIKTLKKISKNPETLETLNQERENLRNSIIEATKKLKDNKLKKRDQDKIKLSLIEDIEQYRSLTVDHYHYTTQAAGARLTDHANLHHLMMHVIGRLLDFSNLWERDQQFVLLGMLASQYPDLLDGLSYSENKLNLTIPSNHQDPIILDLWRDGQGYIFKCYEAAKCLNKTNSDLYNSGWGYKTVEERDRIAEAKRITEGHEAQKTEPGRDKKSQIRHDLAHFNILDGPIGKRTNLTRQINSLRSLLGYDKKLKNAVTKSISEILLRDGIKIKWNLERDRLRLESVHPVSLIHLSMVRDKELRFDMPRVSKRYISMVHGLFDFGNSGYITNFPPGIDTESWPDDLLD